MTTLFRKFARNCSAKRIFPNAPSTPGAGRRGGEHQSRSRPSAGRHPVVVSPSIDEGHRAGARDFPVQNRMIRPLRWTDWFATARGMCPWQASGSGRSVYHEAREEHKEHEGIREKAFGAILQFRPEVPVNRDRTTAHSIRQNVEFHLRDLRGCSNGARWSTP
jgi:hypothetical protein